MLAGEQVVIDYDFDPPLPVHFECPVCLLVMMTPAQTECGHRFCRRCITQVAADTGKCPVDNQPLTLQQVP